MSSYTQPDMFDQAGSVSAPAKGRGYSQPAPWERECVWPAELTRKETKSRLEHLYGDIPKRTRLSVLEVCHRLRCDSNHVYRLIDDGTLDAVDTRREGTTKPRWKIYRYSLIRFLHSRLNGA